MTSYSDKLEMAYQSYERVLDLELALSLIDITPEELELLKTDPDLLARCALCDAHVREDLMCDVRALAKNAVSESVRFAALKELGRTIYPKRFKDDAALLNGSLTITVIDDVK